MTVQVPIERFTWTNHKRKPRRHVPDQNLSSWIRTKTRDSTQFRSLSQHTATLNFSYEVGQVKYTAVLLDANENSLFPSGYSRGLNSRVLVVNQFYLNENKKMNKKTQTNKVCPQTWVAIKK